MKYHHIHSEVLLEKLLKMQSDLLSKKPLPTLIHNEEDFFLKFSNAEFIGISLRGRDDFFEFTYHIGCDDGLINLIRNTTLKTEQLVLSLKKLPRPTKLLDADILCDFFHHDTNVCSTIKRTMDTKKVLLGLLDPNQHQNLSEASAFIILNAEHYHNNNILKACEVANLLWELIIPFYDKESGTTYQACIHENIYFENLSQREKEVAKALVSGMNQTEIAKKFSLSINTIKTHIKNIYLKFGVNSRINFINHIFKR